MRLQPLLVPGWKDSGPDHWQTHWQQHLPRAQRVQQQSWTEPERDPWVQAVSKAIEASTQPVLLIAHSLGCITVAHLSAALRHKVVAAMLVAPADIERPGAPGVFASFAPIPLQALHFPSVVVASSNDPSCTLERAHFFAQAWGSRFEDAGELGHINAESKLERWPQGLKILGALRRRAYWNVPIIPRRVEPIASPAPVRPARELRSE